MASKGREKYQDLLPLITENGKIVGFIPEDWWIDRVDDDFFKYKKCCQNPKNWVGSGDLIALSTEPYTLSTGVVLQPDPWLGLGYTHYKEVICSVCGCKQNATEYQKAGKQNG